MKNYTITVNGTSYDVTVEENAPGESAPAAPRTPKKVPRKHAAPKTPSGSGSIKINAPMPGKILAVRASVGQNVRRGDVLLILEAMKMENEVVAPEDGTVASVDVSTGDSVEAGTVLATLN